MRASDVIASLDELQALCPNLERVALVVAWFGDDLRAAHCRVRPGVDSAIKQTHGATWSVAGVDRGERLCRLDSRRPRRPMAARRPTTACVNLIAELKARGLKVTLYPFVMMDMPADNALPDPYTGAAPQPAYPWRGRITCDPAPGSRGSPDGTGAARRRRSMRSSAAAASADWNYRRMILHYAQLAAERRRRRCVPDRLGAARADARALGVRRLSGGECSWSTLGGRREGDSSAATRSSPMPPTGPNTARMSSMPAQRGALSARSAVGVADIDASASTITRRCRTGATTPTHLDRALSDARSTTAIISPAISAAAKAYDWYYADDAARAAQTRSADHRRPRQAMDVPAQGSVELLVATALRARRRRRAWQRRPRWVPQSKPIWLTEIGCPAVDKGANQPSMFPDPKSSEAALPHFSNGRRDDLIQRRYLEAVLARSIRRSARRDAQSGLDCLRRAHDRCRPRIHLWTWDARPYPVFPAATDVWSDGGELGDRALADRPARRRAARRAGRRDPGRRRRSPTADDRALGEGPDGYVIDRPMAPRAAIDPLALAYAFDARRGGRTLALSPARRRAGRSN